MTLDLDLTSLEMNVSALDDHVETELTVLQETITEIDDRLQQLELTGTLNSPNKNRYQSDVLFERVFFSVLKIAYF